MQFIRDKTFDGDYDFDSPRLVQGVTYERCRFDGCAPLGATHVGARSELRDVHLRDCVARTSEIGPVFARNVTVAGLKTETLLIVTGLAMEHVVLRGRIGRLILGGGEPHAPLAPRVLAEFRKQNDEFYESVDWALDVSEIVVTELRLTSVPAGVIRIDPESQSVVLREHVLNTQPKWGVLHTFWQTCLGSFLQRGDASTVFIAPKGSRRYKDLLPGIQQMRDLGLAEPP